MLPVDTMGRRAACICICTRKPSLALHASSLAPDIRPTALEPALRRHPVDTFGPWGTTEAPADVS